MSDNHAVIRVAEVTAITSKLSSLESALDHIERKVSTVNNKVDSIDDKQRSISSALKSFKGEFQRYVEADRKDKAIQVAETRIISMRQQLQEEFGHYEDVRQMATGILQGTDLGLVSGNTLTFLTEEALVKTPGYWLTPALIALVSWYTKDQPRSEKSIQETLRRDEYKAALFFALTLRRMQRAQSSHEWVKYYMSLQDPTMLDREFALVLEAVVQGLFDEESKRMLIEGIQLWAKEVIAQDRAVLQRQIAHWYDFLMTIRPGKLKEARYAQLLAHADNAQQLIESMQLAGSFKPIQAYFDKVTGPLPAMEKQLEARLDKALTMLVRNFDDRELPLRRQLRLNELIVQYQGDVERAHEQAAVEETAYDECADLLQLLTHAAFNPQQAGVSKATQILAIQMSRPWIIEALRQFVDDVHDAVPQSVTLSLDGWSGVFSDPIGQASQLGREQAAYYEQLKQKALAALKFPYQSMLWSLLVVVGVFVDWWWPLRLGIAGVGIFMVWNAYHKHQKTRAAVEAEMDHRKEKYAQILETILKEAQQYQQRLQKLLEDGKPLVAYVSQKTLPVSK